MYETCASAIADAFTARLSRSEGFRATVLASKVKQHRIGAGCRRKGNSRPWTVHASGPSSVVRFTLSQGVTPWDFCPPCDFSIASTVGISAEADKILLSQRRMPLCME